jgi:hypothetical protein
MISNTNLRDMDIIRNLIMDSIKPASSSLVQSQIMARSMLLADLELIVKTSL